ncbi:dnaJ homolog subfamily C member 30, mitochondrial-like [Toxotes jaculatrix]|uniref:dnaJ homolog subfamily C member 30, mitochondrial-like n=1 Tax=Toxotes jaculatrix TaxID=941984 RepID=UPI001B3AF68F|nr:dnaJ homolog subfamily C member 30, mitochondrial-like [Toxotes jaculatrix]
MAEVRQRFGKGAYDFAHKIYNRHLLGSPTKRGTSAAQASSLSVGFLLGDIKNGELYGVENAAHRVTAGASQDGYSRVTPVLVNNIREKGNVAEYYYCRGLKQYSLHNETQVKITERNLNQCRFNDKFLRTFCTSSPYSRRLCWGQVQFVFTRDYSGNGPRSEPLYKTKNGYYEILGVLPTATQAQIKTAYYKQSFVYHPDRNAGSDEATVRFSEISEAYTVLGNKSLRKKYDRGLLSQSDLIATARPSSKDSTGSSGKQRTESRRSVMGADLRGGIYDFDKFFKSHYNEQLQREKDIRNRKEEMLKAKKESLGEKKMDTMMEICFGLLMVMIVGVIFSLRQG